MITNSQIRHVHHKCFLARPLYQFRPAFSANVPVSFYSCCQHLWTVSGLPGLVHWPLPDTCTSMLEYCIASNCCQSRINAWSRLVTGVAVYFSVIDAGSRINARYGGVAHVTRGDPRMVIHCSWCGKIPKRKASYDIGFKLRAVKCAVEKSKEAAAHKFRVDA